MYALFLSMASQWALRKAQQQNPKSLQINSKCNVNFEDYQCYSYITPRNPDALKVHESSTHSQYFRHLMLFRLIASETIPAQGEYTERESNKS
jgi:hypothetical protein